MKIVYLDASSIGATPLDEIAALGNFTAYANSTPEQARERVKDCDVLIINKIIINEELLSCAPKLKLICESATGVNNIDLEAAKARGIIVRNVAAYSTESVVQQTFTLLLALVGKVRYFDDYVKSGEYSHCGMFTNVSYPFMELCGKTMGIIGMGNIGSRVAQVAAAFGMKVVYYSTSGTSHCTEYPSLSLEELLESSDVVSVHAPLNERTRSLIDYEGLKRMKRRAYILNLGRGGIVDEAALARAVDEGLIAGAGLDVFEREPLSEDNPLMHIVHKERVVFSPHVAWASSEALSRLISKVADNIRQGW